MFGHSIKHASVGIVAAFLALKVIAAKTLFVSGSIAGDQMVDAVIGLLLHELPMTIFSLVGSWAEQVVLFDLFRESCFAGISTEATEALGLVIGYPLIVAGVTFLKRPGQWRYIGGYWLGAQVMTLVAITTGMEAGSFFEATGSELLFPLSDSTLSGMLHAALLYAGGFISQFVEALFAIEMPGHTSYLIGIGLAGAIYGGLWEWHVGHERARKHGDDQHRSPSKASEQDIL